MYPCYSQPARPTEGQTSRARPTPLDLRVQDPVAQDSQHISQETDASIDIWESRFLDTDPMAQNSQDLSQETDTSIDFWESRFLDSEPASKQQQGVEPEGESGETHDPEPPSRLSLSLEDSQASEAAPGENKPRVRDTEGRLDDPDATGSN